MPVMVERWNDDRMDSLGARVDDLDRGVAVLDSKVDDLGEQMREQKQEMREQRQEMRQLGQEMKVGFERMHRLMVQGVLGLSAAYMAGFAALIGLIAVKL